MKEVELKCECGDISASQEDILARSSFLGGGGEEEEEVPQSQPGQGEQDEEDAITMCTLPFTQHSPSSPEEEADSTKEEPRKPRICTRKLRGARDVDPLYKAVLMIPSAPAPTSTRDLLALARQRGIF